MRTILTITMGLLFASVLLVATRCAPGETPAQAPAPVAGKGTPAVSARAPWQESWERTLREARKEGSVVVYTTYGTEWRAALAEAMSQKYGVAVESVTARSAEVAERVMREQKNKLYQADVVVVGSSQYQMTFQPEAVLQSFEKALTLPEVVDPKVWWRGKLPWLDPDTKTYLQFYEYVSPPILINTDLIKPEEVRAWKDLLNPRWKGRILMDDPTIASGRGVKIMSMLAYTIMDWDFINNLIQTH